MNPKELGLRNHPHAVAILDQAQVCFKLNYEILLIYQRDTETKDGLDKAKTPLPRFGPMHTVNRYDELVRLLWNALDGEPPIPVDHIGLAIATTGAVTVLDDDRGGAILTQLYRDGKLDAAMTPPLVQTPRGIHGYFKGGIRGRSGKFKGYLGLDVKGHNGYVICPPTVIGGKTYEWRSELVHADALPPLPLAVVEALGRTAQEAQRQFDQFSGNKADLYSATRAIVNFVAEHDQLITIGQIDNSVYQVAARIADFGIPESTCAILLERDFFGFIEQQQADPYTLTKMATTVANAYRYRENAVGAASIETTFQEIPSAPTSETSEGPPAAGVDDLGARDLLDAIEEAPPVWLVDELITVGSPVAIIAQSGQHKTNVALALCYALSMGRHFGPYRIARAGKILYMDFEGGAGTRERMLRLTETMGLMPPRGWFHYTDKPYFLTDDHDVQKIGQFVKHYGIDLVVFDTFARAVAGVDENDAKDMGRIVARLDQLRAHTGAAIMIIAHTPKSGVNTIRGSGAIDASMHTRISVEITSRPGIEPVEVRMTASHVKDSYSGRSMTLINRAARGIALVPGGGFAVVDPAKAVEELAWEMIDAAGRPIRRRALTLAIVNSGMCRETTAKKIIAELIGQGYRGGVFTAPWATRNTGKRLLWWEPKISLAGVNPEIENLIG